MVMAFDVFAVVASSVTVLLPAFVMRSAESLKDGASASDQLLLVSHLPLPSVQVLSGSTPMAVVAKARPRARTVRNLAFMVVIPL